MKCRYPSSDPASSTAAVVAGGSERSAAMSGTRSKYFPIRHDRRSEEFREVFIKAVRRNLSLVTARLARPNEEQLRQREEQDRKFLMIALQVYTKQNNMQPTELEFVEVKERSLIDEFGLGYLHFNFFVKGLDGKHTIFFAEVHHDLEDENDVYLCTPLKVDDLKPPENNDQALCKACQHQAKDLIHPSCGVFLGGHKDVCPMQQGGDIDDDSDWEFI